MARFEITVGNITQSDAQAIVNATDEIFSGGGGVDAAIHAAAGPELAEECQHLGTCPCGQAQLTAGYLLKAPFVIHTTGPRWQGGSQGEAAALSACYRSCLQLAVTSGIRTIDFPSISTGVFGYPVHLAATVAERAIMDFLYDHPEIQRVRMVCHKAADADAYRQAYNLWFAADKKHLMT